VIRLENHHRSPARDHLLVEVNPSVEEIVGNMKKKHVIMVNSLAEKAQRTV